MPKPVIVVGAGVCGLTSALRLLEHGADVRILAERLPLETTSAVAAAVWYPYIASPPAAVARWSRTTFDVLVPLAELPGAGVVMRDGVELFRAPTPPPLWSRGLPGFRHATDHAPPGYADAHAMRVPVVEMPHFLPWLLSRIESLGGVLERKALQTLDQCHGAAAIVNCTGLGARELVGDTELRPVRGHVVRVRQNGVERFTLDEGNPHGVVYIIPRSRDVVLGGLAQEGNWSTDPDPAVTAAIVERCARVEPLLRGAEILGAAAGLRPARPAVRLEAERRADGTLIVHNYGHGGAGVTMSFGCADDVARLVADHA